MTLAFVIASSLTVGFCLGYMRGRVIGERDEARRIVASQKGRS